MLYIISHDKYLNYYKRGLRTYLPYRFLPDIKSNIIEDIVQKGDIIGKIAGVNIKPVDFNCKKSLEKYIMEIRKLGIENFHNIYLEEINYIPKEALGYMEEGLNLKICKNAYTNISYIPMVIKEIYEKLNQNLQDKEVLIISRDKEITKKTIKLISKDLKFITNIGCSIEDNEEIYNYIFEETGLSLFNSSDINRIIGRYSILINFTEGFRLETSKVRRNAIVFNFSFMNRPDFKDSNNIIHSINDFGFKIEDLSIHKNKWIDDKINSTLYESLNGGISGNVEFLYLGNEVYSIEDYVRFFIKLKGDI